MCWTAAFTLAPVPPLDLSKSKSRNDNLEKTFLARVKQLEASLKKVREAAANPQMNDDPELSRKINEACQVAIADFWVEGKRKRQEHEQQLKKKYEEEIAEERRLSALAVEKQRQKMRAGLSDGKVNVFVKIPPEFKWGKYKPL